MSAGKRPILRYNIIDQCLSSKHKRYWSPEELLDKFAEYDLQVELRTLKYDLQHMREDTQVNYNAPIAYCRKNKGYHYTEDGYSINGERLSHNDLVALSFTVNLMEHFEGGDLLQQAKRTMHKLDKGTRLAKQGIAPRANVMSVQPKPYYKGVQWLGILVDAIFQAQPLAILYQKFNDNAPGQHIFHPYQLKMYSDRWYVRGYSEKHSDVIILALDRMEGITEATARYRHDIATDDKAYFYHTIGISRGTGPVEDIQLMFTPAQGHYIKTLHLHHTQTIVRDNADGLVISLQLIQNYELCQLILSFMPNVKVLQPLSLRDKVVDMLRKGLEWNA